MILGVCIGDFTDHRCGVSLLLWRGCFRPVPDAPVRGRFAPTSNSKCPRADNTWGRNCDPSPKPPSSASPISPAEPQQCSALQPETEWVWSERSSSPTKLSSGQRWTSSTGASGGLHSDYRVLGARQSPRHRPPPCGQRVSLLRRGRPLRKAFCRAVVYRLLREYVLSRCSNVRWCLRRGANVPAAHLLTVLYRAIPAL